MQINRLRLRNFRQHEDTELALGAGRRLQADMIHAADLGQRLFQLPKQFHRPLKQFRRRLRMNRRESRQVRHDFVDLGIVLHGAGTERIELPFDREIALRQAREMTQHFQFSQLGKPGDFLPQQCRRNLSADFLLGRRPIERRSSRGTGFEDKAWGSSLPWFIVRQQF
jgi:hypothetical protein